MSLLDSITGVLNRSPNGPGANAGALVQQLTGLLGQGGGLSGLIQSFQQNGLGHVVQSWIGTSQNLPISAEQIQQVLGQGRIAQVASALGIQNGEAAAHLSQLLPQLIDHLTPNGAVPTGNLGQTDIGTALSSALARLSTH